MNLTQEKDFESLLNNASYFASLMLANSPSRCISGGGAISQAESALRPLLQIIPFQDATNLISSLNIFDLEEVSTGKDKELFLADCAVIPNPGIERLACIAASNQQRSAFN